VTVESGAATTAAAALDQPVPDTPDQSGDFIQLLTPEGERIDHPDYPLDLSADDIRNMYRDLVLVRTIDTVAISLQRQGELGIWASLLGQEAAQIGSGRALSPDDMVFPTYREHGVAWCRGIDPVKLLELYRGVSHGGWAPEEHKFGLYTIVIGAQTLHATGYAMGIQRDGADGGEAVIAYFGDGATSQGDFHEGVNFAAVHRLPVVFVCENNSYAISVPIRLQMANSDVADRAAGYGIPGVTVDGTDVPASFAVCKEAIDRARRGEGPTLIDAKIWRMNSHTSEDNHLKYRSKEEIADASEHDPIVRFVAWLIEQRWITPENAAKVQETCDKEASDAADWAEQQPDPVAEDALTNVFA